MDTLTDEVVETVEQIPLPRNPYRAGRGSSECQRSCCWTPYLCAYSGWCWCHAERVS